MQTDQADLTVDVLSTIQPPGKIVIYPERFSYRYIGMVAKNSGVQKRKYIQLYIDFFDYRLMFLRFNPK